MSKETIWNFFKRRTQLPEVAIAGIMGNFEAESNCEACRVQGDFTADRSVSKRYAEQVDNGTISPDSFYLDQKGWGLAQWTYYTRKMNLFSTCQSYGVGIENENAQLEFFLAEMQNEFVSVWRKLLQATDIYSAAKLVCEQYERPAVANNAVRAQYAQEIYNKFHGSDTPDDPDDPDDKEWVRQAIKYWEDVKKRQDEEIQAKIDELKGWL